MQVNSAWKDCKLIVKVIAVGLACLLKLCKILSGSNCLVHLEI
jgi:hypothetical protein